MTQPINSLVVMFLIITGMLLCCIPLARNGRSWCEFAVDTLRSLLVGWFIVIASGFGVYWFNVYTNLDVGLIVFCLFLGGFWAITRFTPKWLSTTVAGLGLAGIATYLGLLLADPDVQAALQRQNAEECAAQLFHHELPTLACAPRARIGAN